MTLENLPQLSNRRVLITGGLGFIGSNLARACLALGANVTILDCLDPNSGGNLYNIRDISDHIDLNFHNILDFDRVSEAVAGKDILFNCAAATSHPLSMKEPWLNLDTNSRGAINLLEACSRFNRDIKFIHLGTTTQLGSLHYRPADESHPEFPTDIYSANKSASEKYVLIYSKAHNLRASVIRLPNVFGPRAAIHSPDFTFNNYFIGLALQNEDITIYGKGEQLRNVLYVDDAVSALLLAAESAAAEKEVFFAVGDLHYSVADIARATIDNIGSGRLIFVEWPKDRKAIEIGDAIISNNKIKTTLAWHPKVQLDDGLRMTAEYFHGCLDKYIQPKIN